MRERYVSLSSCERRFDFMVHRQSGSPKSGYRSALEELLRVDTSQPDSDQMSTVEPVIQEPAQATPTQPHYIPSSTLSQHPNQTHQQSYIHDVLQLHEVRPLAQFTPALSRTHCLQDVSTQRSRERSTTPASRQWQVASHSLPQVDDGTRPHQWRVTSHSRPQADEGTSQRITSHSLPPADEETGSTNFPTSSFSFQARSWTDHLVDRAPRNGRNPHAISTGPSTDHESGQQTQNSTRTLAPAMSGT